MKMFTCTAVLAAVLLAIGQPAAAGGSKSLRQLNVPKIKVDVPRIRVDAPRAPGRSTSAPAALPNLGNKPPQQLGGSAPPRGNANGYGAPPRVGGNGSRAPDGYTRPPVGGFAGDGARAAAPPRRGANNSKEPLFDRPGRKFGTGPGEMPFDPNTGRVMGLPGLNGSDVPSAGRSVRQPDGYDRPTMRLPGGNGARTPDGYTRPPVGGFAGDGVPGLRPASGGYRPARNSWFRAEPSPQQSPSSFLQRHRGKGLAGGAALGAAGVGAPLAVRELTPEE